MLLFRQRTVDIQMKVNLCVYIKYKTISSRRNCHKAHDYVIWPGKLRREFLAAEPQSWSFTSLWCLKAIMENTRKFSIWKYWSVYNFMVAIIRLRCTVALACHKEYLRNYLQKIEQISFNNAIMGVSNLWSSFFQVYRGFVQVLVLHCIPPPHVIEQAE